MKAKQGIRRLPLAAVAAALAGMTVAGCSDSLGSSRPASMLGDPLAAIGLRPDPNQVEIEYGPRSPLVLPPAQAGELPAPREHRAGLPEAWPNDPDVAARRQREEARQAAAEVTRLDIERASNPISRADLDEWGNRFGRGSGQPGRAAPPEPDTHVVLRPDQLTGPGPRETDYLTPPERSSLIEPPTVYRQPAPNAEGELPEPAQPRRGFLRRIVGD